MDGRIFSKQLSPGQVHLRLLETTDLHMNLCRYDYFNDTAQVDRGLAALAPLIAEARDEAPNTLLFDNGDLLQGTPMGDYVALAWDGVHPMIAAMNALGYDAATVGNHDFNYGLDALNCAADAADHPIALSNVTWADSGDPVFPPYLILERTLHDAQSRPHRVKVGILGLVPPQIMSWDKELLEGRIVATDMVEAAREVVPNLKSAGADLIVALAHTGLGPEHAEPGMENAAHPLAAVPGIDALFMGHTHQQFPTTDQGNDRLHGVPAVMAGAFGSHLGVIDLILDHGPEGWQVADAATHLRPVAPGDTTAAAHIEEVAAEAHRRTLAYIRQPVGRVDGPIHTYFSLVAPCPALSLVCAAQRWRAETLLAGTAFAGLPILSAAAPFKTGGRAGPGYFTEIAAGDLVMRHLADLYPYPNALSGRVIDGRQLRSWLERAASLFQRVTPGAQNVPLFDLDAPSYNFDVMDGVTYAIDVSQPPRYSADGGLLTPTAQRIADLRWQGTPVTDEMRFVVTTNTYRTGAGGQFPEVLEMPVAFDSATPVVDVIRDFLSAQGTWHANPTETWRFAPVPHASAVVDTGPGARQHRPGPAGPPLEDLGDTDDGFARFRIDLGAAST
ncbi:MAG: bifunctional 2',3'-cyclic-nucleotide 2'-phosphodiesterase/3'-nucleotidase [Pseudomonadota bacterium]